VRRSPTNWRTPSHSFATAPIAARRHHAQWSIPVAPFVCSGWAEVPLLDDMGELVARSASPTGVPGAYCPSANATSWPTVKARASTALAAAARARLHGYGRR